MLPLKCVLQYLTSGLPSLCPLLNPCDDSKGLLVLSGHFFPCCLFEHSEVLMKYKWLCIDFRLLATGWQQPETVFVTTTHDQIQRKLYSRRLAPLNGDYYIKAVIIRPCIWRKHMAHWTLLCLIMSSDIAQSILSITREAGDFAAHQFIAHLQRDRAV